MATASTCLTLAILIVAGTLIVSNNLVSAQCGANVPALISKCSKYVKKGGPEIIPSAECCAEVKPIDISCACKLDIEKYVDPKKVIFVARSCGLTVTPGMHCGSFVVPNA